MNLAQLGVGLVHLPGLGPLLAELEHPPSVIEIEPQAFWSHVGGEGPFELNLERIKAAAGAGNVLVHSVGLPVGGRVDGDPRQMAGLAQTLELLDPPWWSDHASFVWTGSESRRRHFGFLMPPLQCGESVGLMADRIKALQDRFGRPFAFETGANYLPRQAGEWSDGAFWGEIAERADCGILLDLHNIWTNERNGREPTRDVVGRLPLDRVWEVHVAGGHELRHVWLDAHSGLPCPEVLALAAEVIPRLPALGALIFEIIPEYVAARNISAADAARCLDALQRLWDLPKEGDRQPCREATSADYGEPLTVGEWEDCLERGLSSQPAAPLEGADEAFAVYRDLIAMVRRGTLAEALPLSLSFLFAEQGEEAVEALLAKFWACRFPEPFVSDEARNFAEFVRQDGADPQLRSVLDFELAAHRVALTRDPEFVFFACEPEPLLRSLVLGAPPDIRPARTIVEVTPPAP